MADLPLSLVVLAALAGYVVGEASGELVAEADPSRTAVGTVFSAVAAAPPELVTAIAAVR